jgi:hypothetical protein
LLILDEDFGWGNINERTSGMKKAILFILIFKMLAGVVWAGSTQRLFTIERSKNSNVLHYDARFSGDGRLIEQEPLIAYWVMFAEDGRKKELSWLEREKAFGFDIKKDSSGDFYRVTLVSYKQREIKIYQRGDRALAEIMIDGRPSFFDKIYISSKEGFLLPKIKYIEIFGRDIETGEKRYEKITAK